MELMIEDLMEEVIERGGSDLHLSTGLPPYIRMSGHLTATDHPADVGRSVPAANL